MNGSTQMTILLFRDDPHLDVHEPHAGADRGEGQLGGGGARDEGRRQRRGGGEAVKRGKDW